MKYRQMLSALFKFIEPDRESVCFMSFYGLYNDNPKYISEKLHQLHPAIKIYWCIDYNRCNISEIPDYVHVVQMGGVQKLIIQNKCRVLVDNLAGWYSMAIVKSDCFLINMIKNKKVYNLSTWHGTPLKRIGIDAYENKNGLTFFTTSDLLMSNSKYTDIIYKQCFQDKMEIRLTGTPRNDILVNIDKKRINDIKKKFGIEDGYRLVIYAPTFRDSGTGLNDNENFDFMYGIDVQMVVNSLKKRFGGEWKFIFRGHQFDQKKNDFKSFRKLMGVEIIDGNLFEDMAEYLAISDVLITDYSGSLFDFIITGRPCFLYTPDKEFYEKSIRGVYEITIPYKYNVNNEELAESICKFDEIKYCKAIEQFAKKLGVFEDGKASVRAVEIIMEQLRK